MSIITSELSSSNRSIPSTTKVMATINPTDLKENQGFFTANTHSNISRIGRSMDDSAILSMQRQYGNFDLFKRDIPSNGIGDFSQLAALQQLAQLDNLDSDEDDIPYDDGEEYDYPLAIQERLKRANAQLENDQTSSALRNPQRVSFDNVVKAVDIIQKSHEYQSIDSNISPQTIKLPEQSTDIESVENSSRVENDTHEYTVPLNDIQPKQGLSLTEQIKAAQFGSVFPNNDRWATTPHSIRNDRLSNRDDDVSSSSFKSNENQFDSENMFNFSSTSTSSKKSMIVAVNDRIELQDEDDYIAKYNSFSSNTNGNDSFDITNKPQFIPTPPTEPKPQQQSTRGSFIARPKSSTVRKSQVQPVNIQRSKSAGIHKSIEKHNERPSSGVDFKELLRKAAEKKRAELKADREKQKEAAEKRQRELELAKEGYERWLQDKNAELKRINEEKRAKQKEKEKFEEEEKQRLNELREKKHKEWLERKRADINLIEQFKQLKASEQLQTFEESDAQSHDDRINNERAYQRWFQRKSIENILIKQFKQAIAAEESETLGDPITWLHRDRIKNERAFKKWLRKKREQSIEEKRRMRLELQQIRHLRQRTRGRHQYQEHEIKRPWEYS